MFTSVTSEPSPQGCGASTAALCPGRQNISGLLELSSYIQSCMFTAVQPWCCGLNDRVVRMFQGHSMNLRGVRI